MTKTLLVSTIVMVSFGTATAGGQAGSIGVGAEFEINNLDPLGAVSVNYDAGKFHVGGFLGFADPAGADNTDVRIGGRFFFHVASTAMSDFSVGGNLGIHSHYTGGGAGGPTRKTDLFIEPSFQIRAFIASNVALSFTGGISIGTIDASDVVLGAEATGAAGIHYYFF